MPSSAPSALVTDRGALVLLRLNGRFYSLSQQALRQILNLPEGPPGVGITIDRDRLQFEFAGDHQTATVTAAQLGRILAKRIPMSV
ncbi:MAG TPA: hypothetical protein VML55_13575 [Planctomycetaceae bacterium]|nr:hypothetical protein [Planctomycetaceae bacterium]